MSTGRSAIKYQAFQYLAFFPANTGDAGGFGVEYELSVTSARNLQCVMQQLEKQNAFSSVNNSWA